MSITPDYQTPARMEAKRRAIPLPDLKGKFVLDCGTDFGAWAFLAAELGAKHVLGVDRNREVRGVGLVDLIAMNNAKALNQGITACQFRQMELGRQWEDLGAFDLVLVFSMYHHWFEQCGDHKAIWYWLSRQVLPAGEILFEGPVDDSDPVVRANVSEGNRSRFHRDAILAAAERYFFAQYVGPALHEPTREVWRFVPKLVYKRPSHVGEIRSGAGGASSAFTYADGRRIREISKVIGVEPVPGSLNVRLSDAFDFYSDYYRAQILDVSERGRGLDVEWRPRWMRFYPVNIEGILAWAIRFEGETYPDNFVELVAPECLRDSIKGTQVCLSR